jgi:hypothetical protein
MDDVEVTSMDLEMPELETTKEPHLEGEIGRTSITSHEDGKDHQDKPEPIQLQQAGSFRMDNLNIIKDNTKVGEGHLNNNNNLQKEPKCHKKT